MCTSGFLFLHCYVSTHERGYMLEVKCTDSDSKVAPTVLEEQRNKNSNEILKKNNKTLGEKNYLHDLDVAD